MIIDLIQALQSFGSWQMILALIAGGTLGTIFSVIPGLTGTLALALILPYTYGMQTDVAFVMMVGMIGGTIYGGSLTAIAIGIPGSPGSIATTFDGHPMYQKGR